MAALTTAGDLREVIELQQNEEIDDGYGNVYGGWTTKITAPARIRILKGSETIIASRLAGKQTAVITARWQPDIEPVTPAWRAKDARTGKIYDIKAVTPDERKAWVDLLTEATVS